LPTKLEIPKNKSCRGDIELQLSQRVTYFLINGFVGKTCWRYKNSWPWVTVHSAFHSNLSELSLKIWMSANYEKCVPGNSKQLLYWPILNFYSEIWRTRKKTESAFLDLGFWPRIWTLTKGLCEKVCLIMSNMFRSQLNLINTTN
jgi:hypothetical protein